MDGRQHLPDVDKLSVLTAMILLAYALTPFLHIPQTALVIRLPFAVFSFSLNVATLVSLITALLAAIGTDWLLHGHPHLAERPTWPHLILPALTAWAIGLPLNTLEVGLQWWAVFALGGLLLVLVFIAEYIVVDFDDARHGFASIGLTALSFALYLILAIAVRAAGLRLYQLLPILLVPLGLVGVRTLFLRLGGRWSLAWMFGTVAFVGQFALGLQYWPLSPLAYGLVLTGPAYALTSIAGSIEDERPWPSLLVEPLLVMVLLWGLAFLVGG